MTGNTLLNCILSQLLMCLGPLCRAGGCWWWIPVAGPMVGGVVGAGIYFLFIELHQQEPEKQEENNVQDKYEMITMSKNLE